MADALFVFPIINSALAVLEWWWVSWGDAVSLAFAALAYAALLLLFYCLRRFDRAGRGEGGGGGRNGGMGARFSALAAVGVAAVMCSTALDAHKTGWGDDMASAALLFLSYTNLVATTGLFLRTVARR